MPRLGNKRSHLTCDHGKQLLQGPWDRAKTKTQGMVHQPALLGRTEVERPAEEAMFAEKNHSAQPSQSQHCPAHSMPHCRISAYLE